MNFRDRVSVFFLSLIPGFLFWTIFKRKDWEEWYL